MLMKDYNNSEILIYQSESEVAKIAVTFMDETVWLSQQQMAELFQIYNLDMIISLGYRIKSKIATNFRRWGSVQFRTAIYGIKDIFRRLSDKKRY